MIAKARRLYEQYKTDTREYKELAAALGYASAGDLNRPFALERAAKHAR